MPKRLEPSERKRWHPEKPLVPGAKRTRVTYQGDTLIMVDDGIMHAEVYGDGELNVYIRSEKVVEDHMSLSRELTDEFREWLNREEPPGNWANQREAWLKSKGWTLAEYGSGNTYNWDNAYFWGSVFEYSHFQTDEGEEGAIIKWHEGGDARSGYSGSQVWLGDFEEFIGVQDEGDPHSVETFFYVNDRLEGGVLWALEQLGALDRDPEELTKQVRKALEEMALQERREIERSSGQTYFWPEAAP